MGLRVAELGYAAAEERVNSRHRMVAPAGMTSDRRYHLVDGIITMMASPKRVHRALTLNIGSPIRFG